MAEKIQNEVFLQEFDAYLYAEEKSMATREKYIRDVKKFLVFSGTLDVSKNMVVAYKQECLKQGYAVRSVNSMLASINCMLRFAGRDSCMVRSLKIQSQTYCTDEQELTKPEYLRLLCAAKKNEQLYLLLQTICSTGIRVSELRFFTMEAVIRGEVVVNLKGKSRRIWISAGLQNKLLEYARAKKIDSGELFVNRKGRSLDRSTIWKQMKRLCSAADVVESKVFPHNLRKLFARTFYDLDRDVAKLADVLGHSSIDTTRIYIMSTGSEHRKIIEKMDLCDE